MTISSMASTAAQFATSPSSSCSAWSCYPTATYSYSGFGSSTSASPSASHTGSDTYPVFPNGIFMFKFALVSSQDSGLTDLDIDLYNECYLPYNPLPYHSNQVRQDAAVTSASVSTNPNYQINVPPCKRQSAISTSCYFQDTNGTFVGIQISNLWKVQQQCFCEQYPFFDSASGCMDCFKEHGGVEGYHWFPQSYVSAVSATYCNADSRTTGFYPFVQSWSKTAAAAGVTTTTASDVLGTQTAASLYYTPAANASSSSSSKSAAMELSGKPFGL